MMLKKIVVCLMVIALLVPSVSSAEHEVEPLRGVIQVKGGSQFALALLNDGSVFSWGKNSYGQLGRGEQGSGVQYSIAGKVEGLPKVTQIATGVTQAFAIDENKKLWAWGYNGNGELGDGTTINRPFPVMLDSLAEVVDVDSGGNHTIALTSDGSVWAWGQNNQGQAGLGSIAGSLIPRRVEGLPPMLAIAAGLNHSLALDEAGCVWAWGDNFYGQLGVGNTVDQTTPVKIGSLADIRAIAAGANHSLAITTDGALYTWGSGGNGRLGLGSTSLQKTPQLVSSISSAISVAAGTLHSMALTSEGLLVWGSRLLGQLGLAGTSDVLTPTAGPLLAEAISCGNYFSFGLVDGEVYAWGANESGQLGNGSTVNSYVPTKVVRHVPPIIPVEGIALSSLMLELFVFAEVQLTAEVSPPNATNTEIIWTSSDTLVATVSSTGLVCALSPGSATIRAETIDGAHWAECEITVILPAIPVTGLLLSCSEASLVVGDTLTLSAFVEPEGAEAELLWHSTDTAVATVDSSGCVSAIAPGTVRIVVETTDGLHSQSCTVVIANKQSPSIPEPPAPKPRVYYPPQPIYPSVYKILTAEESQIDVSLPESSALLTIPANFASGAAIEVNIKQEQGVAGALSNVSYSVMFRGVYKDIEANDTPLMLYIRMPKALTEDELCLYEVRARANSSAPWVSINPSEFSIVKGLGAAEDLYYMGISLRQAGQYGLFIDDTPPLPPITGTLPKRTVNTNVGITGHAEPRTVLRVTHNDILLPPIIVEDSGEYAFDLALVQGDNRVSLTLIDRAGNISDETVIDITKVGAELSVEPDNGWIPLRFVCEQAGFTVEWHEASRLITLSNELTIAELSVDSGDLYVFGVLKERIPIMLREGRSYVQLTMLSTIGLQYELNDGAAVVIKP